MVFDGKKFAEGIIAKLPKKKAKLAIFLDPDNVSGAKYVEKKIQLAERLGVELKILNSKSEISNKSQIQNLNQDPGITGIMIQLPFPNSQELINLIDPKKDVDGLRNDSPYLPAVVRAVKEVLLSLQEDLLQKKMVVVGCKGFVGQKLLKVLGFRFQVLGMDKDDFDPEKIKSADVIISTTGQAGLIKSKMVKPGVIAIDVGYPKGDFDPQVAAKASFFTPVPGGVGPVTVVMLFQNLLKGYNLKR